MASHAEHHHSARGEAMQLSGGAFSVAVALLVLGVLGVLASLGLSMSGSGVRRFYFAYLVSYVYFLSIALGGMFFVLLQALTRAGWSVAVRRVGESLAVTLPIMALLSAPLLVSVWSNKGELYPWAQPKPDHPVMSSAERAEMIDRAARSAGGASHTPAAADAAHAPPAHAAPPHGASPDHSGRGITALTMGKLYWLNPGFFTGRLVFYFAFWSLIALHYWRKSRQQDESGDSKISDRLAIISAPLMLFSVLTVTFAVFDLVMSLDSDWYSTILGFYFISECAAGMFATLIVTCVILQNLGYLQHSINKEHYHDLGKFLFAFTFFFGYIAFSQYMLIWYANFPETTYWFANRGATTNPDTLQTAWGWSIVTLLLLFGRILIPFAGLLSRHVKRNRASLFFWAVWVLVFIWVDMFWLIMPEYDRTVTFGLPEVLAFIGLGGIFVGTFIWRLSASPLRPVRDSRLPESLAFTNI